MSVLSLLDIIDKSPSINTPLIFNDSINTSNVKNLLLIDSIVSESQLFFDSSNTNTFPIIYSNNSNRDDFIKLLEDKFSNGLERIAFVFHDNIKDGKEFLNQELFFLEYDIQENINSYSANTQLLIDVTKKYGIKNIDFLACNSLNYQNWIKFYDILSKETGVIVGASNDKTGNLNFHKPGGKSNLIENEIKTFNKYNFEWMFFTPVSGQLFLFPSYLPHSVGINQSEITRISLSFNTFYSGDFGSINNLTRASFSIQEKKTKRS